MLRNTQYRFAHGFNGIQFRPHFRECIRYGELIYVQSGYLRIGFDLCSEHE